jgi:hypothetical protein
MRVEPKFSDERPYRWIGCVTLTPEELEQIINALPPGDGRRLALREAWDNARARAAELNEVDRKGVQ